jgi:hypothetical protein
MRSRLLYSSLLIVCLSCAYAPERRNDARIHFLNSSHYDGILYEVNDSLITLYPFDPDDEDDQNLRLSGEPQSFPIRTVDYVQVATSDAVPVLIGGLAGSVVGTAVGCAVGNRLDRGRTDSYPGDYSYAIGSSAGVVGCTGGALFGCFASRASGELDPKILRDRSELKSHSVKGFGL